jgi:hypothetical protein
MAILLKHLSILLQNPELDSENVWVTKGTKSSLCMNPDRGRKEMLYLYIGWACF